jgi:hypothetical protein
MTKYYEYHIEIFHKSIGWEGYRINEDETKRNDKFWLRFLKNKGSRMTLYIKDEDRELDEIITLKTL